MSLLYSGLAAAGLVGTWWFNLRFDYSGELSYLEGWFANAAASSAAVDVIVTAIVASVFMLAESHRLGMRWAWLLVIATPLTAIAFTFPFFLAWRERVLRAERFITQPIAKEART